MTFLLGLLLAIAIVIGLDRLGLWMEARGWVYYRKKRGTRTLGRAVLETQALLDPGKRHVLEAERTDPEEEDSADPPAWSASPRATHVRSTRERR
jgi:hypothetical protein